VKLLVLGGTKFLGRHFSAAALAAGHDVTLFTRGQTNPDLFPEAEHLRGDRDGELSALEGGSWDAVVDTSGYFPRIVRASAELLTARADRFTFISSVSVYADLSRPVDESSPVGTIEDETIEDFGPEFQNYGPLKALCEQAARKVFGERALIVRPGFIVGPDDPTYRFVYWPRRMAAGGTMLAPGPPEAPIQFVDVRDLAGWVLRMVERGANGTYNATNEGVSWGGLLAACPGDAEVAWASDEFLVEHGVGEEDLPLWSGDPGFRGLHRADVSAAVAEGLTFRPVEETVEDTMDWDRTRDERPPVGLSPEREAELVRLLQT
jgi:nucleoside-diphosphate-sugar epimerase